MGYEPKLMCPYVFRTLSPLELGFEFLLNIWKHKKSASFLVVVDLS